MLVFATSDKGGTGRSVTSSNLAYRRALSGSNVAYLDFDFGSPTAGTIFHVDLVRRGASGGGIHSYLQGRVDPPLRLDVWSHSDRSSLRGRPSRAGKLVLFPGDEFGGEFPGTKEIIKRCARLFARLDAEFDICLIDLSAGRSHATDIVLAATALPELREVENRWLVFHRWTRQHLIAANGLVFGKHGLLEASAPQHTGGAGHDRAWLLDRMRFVRTAVVDPESDALGGLRPEQVAWLRKCDTDLKALATKLNIGRTTTIGSIPLDPLLQWREQLITDTDTLSRQVANVETVEAFVELAHNLDDENAWATL
ncbi:SCO2523 family variant P-loop protein [Catellatospora tritici]|uniref:SCO2523 family variant P-loop protein n=1 Tax=Catellatospora tritici TaxID=2851566 RepID=UPI001C2CCE48|nr:SCO2523 family variant P-loop protein [Catellatospora tritici]MBV1850604.1 ParA family protein [Catellatospora tritici]